MIISTRMENVPGIAWNIIYQIVLVWVFLGQWNNSLLEETRIHGFDALGLNSYRKR
jgi:hypothetical protein